MSARRFLIVCVVIILLGVAIAWAASLLTSYYYIGNIAQVKTVGVSVYADSGCTEKVDNIAWGVLQSGEAKNFSCFVRSESNVPVTLSMNTSSWQPENISVWVLLNWNLESVKLEPNVATALIFTLVVNNTIPYGFDTFTFDITVSGSG